MKASSLEERFRSILDERGFVGYRREYRFSKTRKWRFDFAWPEIRLAVELQGGVYSYLPSHASAKRIASGYEKINAAQEDGWVVLQYDRSSLSAGRLEDTVMQIARVAELCKRRMLCEDLFQGHHAMPSDKRRQNQHEHAERMAGRGNVRRRKQHQA